MLNACDRLGVLEGLSPAEHYWPHVFRPERLLQWQTAHRASRLLSQPHVDAREMEVVAAFGHDSENFLLLVLTQTY